MANNYSIYYFSGTGNSLSVSKKLAELLDGSYQSIPRVMANIKRGIFASNLIIVFPSYLAMIYGVPVIVKEFIACIPNISNKKISLVCSCGGYESVNALPSVKILTKVIKEHGGHVINYHTLRLPMNNLDYEHIPIPIEKDTAVLIAKSEEKINRIAKNIKQQKVRYLHKSIDSCFIVLMKPMFYILKKISFKAMLDLAKEPYNTSKSIENVFHLTDKSITVDSTCNGCRICEKVCPVNNIVIEERHPRWKHHCEMCFACHEWCPQKAIHHWGRKDGTYYHHPSINLSDVIQENKLD